MADDTNVLTIYVPETVSVGEYASAWYKRPVDKAMRVGNGHESPP